MKRKAIALLAAFLVPLALGGCGTTKTAPSVGAKVWDPFDSQYVEEPALGLVPTKLSWTLDVSSFKTHHASDAGIFTLSRDGRLAAVDPATGSPQWDVSLPPLAGTASADELSGLSPIQMSGQKLLVLERRITTPKDPSLDIASQFDVFDAATGKFLWTRVGSRLLMPKKISDDLLAFDLNTGRPDNVVAYAGLEAVDAATGEVRWTTSGLDLCERRGSLLLCINDATEDDGEVVAIDSQSGKQTWSAKLPHVTIDPESFVPGPLPFTARVGDTIYVSLRPDSLSALDAQTGAVKWTANPGGDGVARLDALDAEHILLRVRDGSTSTLVSVKVSDGTTDFFRRDTGPRGRTEAADLATLVVGDQFFVVVTDVEGSIRMLDRSGKPVGKKAADCFPRSEVRGDTYFCVGEKGLTLYSLPELKPRGAIATETPSYVGAYRVNGSWFVAHGKSVEGLATN
jgi:outer membrane protein assembly factor BamB